MQGYDSDGKPKRMKFSPRTECERCGECCRRDTPVILKDDMELLRRGVISEKDIYTIREDEKKFVLLLMVIHITHQWN